MPLYDADPYYEDVLGPAGWIRQQAEDRGLHVEVDRNLTIPGYASRDVDRIVARPGLAFPTLHWLLACGVIAQIFGPEAAPDLPIAPGPLDAKVIPFQRGPAFTFCDNKNRFGR